MATVVKSDRITTITPVSETAGPFNVGFRLFDVDAVRVYVDNEETLGFTLTASFLDGYDDNATITLNTPTASVIRIEGYMAADRQRDLVANDPNLTHHLNIELARHAAMLSEMQRETERSIRTTGAIPPFEPQGEKTVLVWEDGKITSGPMSDVVESAEEWALAALAARDAARRSEAAAGDSEEQAGLAADAAMAARDKAQDWAESPAAPDGAGTASARTWAMVAQGASYASRAEALSAQVLHVVTVLQVTQNGRLLQYARDPSGTALTTADGASWSPAGEITPQHWGAVQDDSTDDTDAFNDMLTWAAGREVFIPNATNLPYYCAGTILVPNGCTVRMEGTQSWINHATEDRDVGIRSSAMVAMAMRSGELDLGNSRDITFDRVRIILDTDGAAGFKMSASKMCRFEACLVDMRGLNQTGFHMTASKSGRTYGGCFYNIFVGCKVVGKDAVRSGIGFLYEGERNNGQCNGNQHFGCSVEFVDKGVALGPGLSNHFADCVIERCNTVVFDFQDDAWRTTVQNLYTEGSSPIAAFSHERARENTVTVSSRSSGQGLVLEDLGSGNRVVLVWEEQPARSLIVAGGTVTPKFTAGHFLDISTTDTLYVDSPTGWREGDTLTISILASGGARDVFFAGGAYRLDVSVFDLTESGFRGVTIANGNRLTAQFRRVTTGYAGNPRWVLVSRPAIVSGS